MICRRLVLSAIATGCAVHAASAQPFVQAQATVNSSTVFTPNNNMMGSGSGVTIAGAKVFHDPDQDYEVSNGLGFSGQNPVAPTNRQANAAETTLIDNLVTAVAAIPSAANPNETKAYEASAMRQLATIVPNNAANPKVFPEIRKLPFLQQPTLAATTKTVANPPSESAVSTAAQTAAVTAFGTKITTTQNPVATAKGNDKAAAAVAINRDPLAVAWITPVVTLTLSDFTTNPSSPTALSLTAKAPPGGAAAAFYDMNVLSKPFSSLSLIPTTIAGQDMLEATAQQLFDFSALLVTDGATTTADFNFTLEQGAALTDSLGDTSASALDTRLDNCATTPAPTCPLSLSGGVLSFTKDFSFSVTLPDDPNSSLLFLREASLVAAEVPEPATPAILGVALLLLGAVRARRLPATSRT